MAYIITLFSLLFGFSFSLFSMDSSLVNSVTQQEEKPALHRAVLNNDMQGVKKLIDMKVYVNEQYNGITPLHYACQKGNLPIVQKLISAGAEVNMPYRILIDEKWNIITYPLHIAALYRHAHLIYALVINGALMNTGDNNGFTPLATAAEIGDEDTVQALLDCKADPLFGNYINKDKKIFVRPFDLALFNKHYDIARKLINIVSPNSGISLIHHAVKNNKESIQCYLKWGGDINVRTKTQQTPLHLACLYGKPERVEMLLACGANPNVRDENGDTPLMYAIKTGKTDIDQREFIEKKIDILLSYHADINLFNNSHSTALLAALSYDCPIAVIDKIIKENADVTIATHDNRTAIHFSSFLEDDEQAVIITKKLIDAGAAVDVMQSKIFLTPLIIAIQKNNPKLVTLLLNAGANPDRNDSVLCVPIFQAIKNRNVAIVRILIDEAKANVHIEVDGHDLIEYAIIFFESEQRPYSMERCKEVIDLLIKAGVDVNKNDHRKSALHLACGYNLLDVVLFLLQHNAHAYASDEENETPLFFAAICGNYAMVEALLKHGALVNSKTKTWGYTPLSNAVKYGHHDIVDLLLKYGADKEMLVENQLPIDIAREKNFIGIVKLLEGEQFVNENSSGKALANL